MAGFVARSARALGARGLLTTAAVVAAVVPVSASVGTRRADGPTGRVLLVGTYRHRPGGYRSIQAAVDAARPGDWILVAPGDYHEAADATASSDAITHGYSAAVIITTPHLHLRGMNATTVVVDGTNGTDGKPCSASHAAQNFGPPGPNGEPAGRNGIVVWRADGVSIENLTVCNFVDGSGDTGNGIWWNGGDGSGQIGLSGYTGRYLTATSTYYSQPGTAAQYGIFASNAAGPGAWATLYASNFADSGMYIGGCRQVCDATISDAWMEYNTLGYSGTNSGGSIVIEHSQFDNNKDGLDTNTGISGDPPAPQDGSCPNGGISPITHTRSCWVFTHNLVQDNNNPNVPQSGSATGPTGTGMTVSGGRHDTVLDNTFADNGAWGTLFAPFPDPNPPSLDQTCAGTGGVESGGLGCVYDPQGDALLHNRYVHNAYFGNPGNADYGQIRLNAGTPRNCFAQNHAPQGSVPSDLERSEPTCGPISTAASVPPGLLNQVLCDSGLGPCPAGSTYPQLTGVVMHPLPRRRATMPNPCAGVPSNPWCS